MASNQEGRHAAFRAISGTTGNYNEDSMATFIAEGGTGTSYNELFVSWLQFRTESTQTDLADLMNVFAAQEGFTSWDDINTFEGFVDTSGHKFTVKTDNTGTSNDDQFTAPTQSVGTYDCVVDWGDSTSDTITTYNDAAWTHTYAAGAGTYTITITGQCEGWRFNNGGDRSKLIEIKIWGDDFRVGNSGNYFYGCEKLTTVSAPDALNLTGTLLLNRMFQRCFALTSISNMNSWNTSSVTSLFNLFTSSTLVNSNIADWNVSSVTDFRDVFSSAQAFNQDLSGWNVSSGTTFAFMFLDTPAFNQDLSSWTLTAATSFSGMFFNSTNTNFDISSWNFNGITTASNMWSGASFSQTNYDLFLIAQDGNSSLKTGVPFHAGTAQYSTGAATDGHDYLTGTKTWTFTDGGQA